MEFEVCIDSVEGAIAASQYGAKRVELCSALSEGGLTPSLGMIEACVAVSSAEVFVMIRPSAGGFVYSDYEIELMGRDIEGVGKLGAKGVVFGVLTPELKVDIKKNLFLMETALKSGLDTTFHRAIDVCSDPLAEIQHLVHLGFDRILSSGAQAKALQGLNLLTEMSKQANGSIEVMAGSGINPKNIDQFLNCGLNAVHFTAHQRKNNTLPLDMGPEYTVDLEKIRQIATVLK